MFQAAFGVKSFDRLVFGEKTRRQTVGGSGPSWTSPSPAVTSVMIGQFIARWVFGVGAFFFASRLLMFPHLWSTFYAALFLNLPLVLVWLPITLPDGCLCGLTLKPETHQRYLCTASAPIMQRESPTGRTVNLIISLVST